MAKNDDSKVFIGKKKTMSYVMAAMVILNDGPVKILARGRSISRAVDVSEVILHKFVPGSKYGEIIIETEVLANQDGTNTNVSSIEIEIIPPKRK